MRLPLTIATGAACVAALFEGDDLWVAAVIGAIVAPTDAALGELSDTQDERGPGPPAAWAERRHRHTVCQPLHHRCRCRRGRPRPGSAARRSISSSVPASASASALRAPRCCRRPADGLERALFRLAVVGLALVAYAVAIEAGGNGFVGAFIGGLWFGSITPANDDHTVSFTDDARERLSLLVWFLFGATMIVPAFEHVVWQDVVFALLALTVVRMVPVGIALAGSGGRATVAFIGWFGPRGLGVGAVRTRRLRQPRSRRRGTVSLPLSPSRSC